MSKRDSGMIDLTVTDNLDDGRFDGLVVVAKNFEKIAHEKLVQKIQHVLDVDKSAKTGVTLIPTEFMASCKRTVFVGLGKLDKDYEDVRSYAEAAEKGLKRILQAGSTKPLLYVPETTDEARYAKGRMVAFLGAAKAAYVTLEMRESVPEKRFKVELMGFYDKQDTILGKVKALEQGRIVSRDIGGSDPERMAAPRVEEYVKKEFAGTGVKVEVVKGQSVFEKEYPCFAAVNRAASTVDRHDGRVIWLTYEPSGPVEKTLMLVGKGVTYDTGGADIKAGGIMAGMSRDKCGAADVAGIVKAISIIKPKNLKVVGAMAMVRNSVGENCYVADEIITSRAGVRLRVGNTDAEGRMAMVDVLCHMKEKALKEVNPYLMTIATLTGHEVVAYGNYSAIMDNGPARKSGVAQAVQKTGDAYGDMFEISTMRRDDFEFIKDGSCEFVDILQCNNVASSRTPRGHQFPAAFLHQVAGLDKHMLSSQHPLKYSHIDVAGSSGNLPEPTTASSVVALAMHFCQ